MQYNSPVPLIGLVGKKRSGKDTFANYTGFQKVALADPLREAALGLDPIVVGDVTNGLRLSEVVDSIGWEMAKDSYPEVRRTLQRLGTESIRALDPNFWVRIAAQRIIETRDAGMPVVVTDVRYPNEIDLIHSLGGTVIRVVGRGQVGDAHPSETVLDDVPVDIELDNSGSLIQLQMSAEFIVDQLTLRWTAENQPTLY